MSSVLIIGKPNSGKSLLFNRLTGLAQKVANFPGATVSVKTGSFKGHHIIDCPGVYTLNAITKDEEIAIDSFKNSLKDDDVKVVLCVLDISRLERSLVLGLQVQQEAMKNSKTVIFALNMMDTIKNDSLKEKIKNLETYLGSPVFFISAKTQEGIDILETELDLHLKGESEITNSSIVVNNFTSRASEITNDIFETQDLFLKNQNKLDKLFLSNIFGGPVFILIMLVLFQAIFSWSSPMIDFVDGTIVGLGEWVSGLLPDGIFKDFINDAIFGGFGSFLVFVPQIAVLTFIIGILEDSGYLARAAIICHRPLSLFGLSGKSFIPFLTGHACAIPAIMAARTIESPKKRLITMLTVPLMSCSARLPVYSLFILVFIPAKPVLGGFITMQALAFFGLYFFGLFVAALVSLFLSNSKFAEKDDAPFIIELPPYRVPGIKPLIQKSVESSLSFITKAGPVIFMVSMVIWGLGYFPNQGDISSSWLAELGQIVEPIFAPLGVDWKYAVAILVSFLAREVFVGTLGTINGLEGADEEPAGLIEQMQASSLTLGSGLGLLAFYVIALQCVATVGVLQKEIGNAKTPWVLFVAYSVLAYIVALIIKLIVDGSFA